MRLIPNEPLRDLEDQLLAVAGQLNATEYHLITLLDEFDQRDGWRGDGIRSFAHWLNWKLGLGHVIAREKVRVARSLRELPKMSDAFSQGLISYSKIRAMTRVATPQNEALLLQFAEFTTASHMERLCRQYKQVQQSDEDDPVESWKPEQWCEWYQSTNDTTEFRITLPTEDAEVLIAAIQRVIGQLDSGQEKQNVSAEAGQDASCEKPEYQVRRAQALVVMAEQSLSQEIGQVSTVRDVVVHLNANTRSPQTQIAGGTYACNSHFEHIRDETAKRLACDCRVTPIYEDDNGSVLDIGRKSRVISSAMRLALSVRDRGCRFPGCGQTKWTDAHHIKHWIDGGETKLSNLITLCRSHHTMLHNGEYQIDTVGDQFTFRNTRREDITICPVNTNQKMTAEIRSQPVLSGWNGDRLDWDSALYCLDEADRRGRT